jgi:integrase
MTKATPLPSGNWRARAIYYDDKGKRCFKSFTSKSENQANYEAEQWEKQAERNKQPENITIGKAIDNYIKNREPILSPSTITGYRRIRKNYFSGLMNITLLRFTNEKLQEAINKDKTHSAKSINNAFCLLSAAFNEYYPDFRFNIKLPKKKKVLFQIPTIDETGVILNSIENTDIEIPILLSIYLGLRMSEIRGLKYSDINNDKITIHNTIVDTDNGATEKDETKNNSSTRIVTLPKILINVLGNNRNDEHIVKLTGSEIYKRYQKMLKNNNLPHFRFHDLRHVNASIMLRLNIPTKYQMQRGGWSTESTLRTTYQHTMADYETVIDNQIYEYIDKLKNDCATKCATPPKIDDR